MKKSLAALLLGLCVISAPANAQCWNEAMVTANETRDGSTVQEMNKEQITLFIKGVVAMYNFPTREADKGIAFTLSKNKVTRVVYFVNGCATSFTDLPTADFIKIIGEAT